LLKVQDGKIGAFSFSEVAKSSGHPISFGKTGCAQAWHRSCGVAGGDSEM
jgi:hypothetical protein